MVNRNLIREFDVSEEEFEQVLAQSLAVAEVETLDSLYEQTGRDFEVGHILPGTVLRVDGADILIDVGYKSEGVVSRSEWEEGQDPPEPGQEVEVLLEEVEDETGLIRLSKRKAARIRGWERVISKHAEGDVVTGGVTKKIKGGLLVDIGVSVFLPASQVDIRRPHDIADYIGRSVQCKILKIDEARRNIVVSRRKLIEEQREELKKKLLAELQVGQKRRGVVKNIADFGAFVDLGGIDGLLHITDMSWGRVSHPSELVSIDQEVEVSILNVDRAKEKIALGTKQLTKSPWENVETRYPVATRVRGEVVNVMSYGAFVKLEEGIEGLVHISEMSWTKRINHPNELVRIGDEIEVVVLGINKEKQEISLGMKQTQPNPWDKVAEKYPPGTLVDGTVRNLTNYGAFIEIEEGIDGLLHVSDISWTRKIGHPSEVLEKGQELQCQVLSVDQNRKRIALGLKQLREDPWENDIPGRYAAGSKVQGKVTKLTNFGVFVELEPGLEGLLHISELSDHKVESPEEVVSVGDEIEVKILRVDSADRKIGLSRKRLDWTGDEAEEGSRSGAPASEKTTSVPATSSSRELKGGIGDSSGPLIASLPQPAKKQTPSVEEKTSEPKAPQAESKPDEQQEPQPTEELAPSVEGKTSEQLAPQAESKPDEQQEPQPTEELAPSVEGKTSEQLAPQAESEPDEQQESQPAEELVPSVEGETSEQLAPQAESEPDEQQESQTEKESQE